MVFKLALEAQKHWCRLQGFELIPKVVVGVQFVDGEEQTQQAALTNHLTGDAPLSDTQHLTISPFLNPVGERPVKSVFDSHTFHLNWLTACGVRNVIGHWLLQPKLKKCPSGCVPFFRYLLKMSVEMLRSSTFCRILSSRDHSLPRNGLCRCREVTGVADRSSLLCGERRQQLWRNRGAACRYSCAETGLSC